MLRKLWNEIMLYAPETRAGRVMASICIGIPLAAMLTLVVADHRVITIIQTNQAVYRSIEAANLASLKVPDDQRMTVLRSELESRGFKCEQINDDELAAIFTKGLVWTDLPLYQEQPYNLEQLVVSPSCQLNFTGKRYLHRLSLIPRTPAE